METKELTVQYLGDSIWLFKNGDGFILANSEKIETASNVLFINKETFKKLCLTLTK